MVYLGIASNRADSCLRDLLKVLPSKLHRNQHAVRSRAIPGRNLYLWYRHLDFVLSTDKVLY